MHLDDVYLYVVHADTHGDGLILSLPSRHRLRNKGS